MSDSNDADEANATTDHALVRELVEQGDGYPAHLAESEGTGDGGLLRIGSERGDPDDSLKEISWDEFFDEFEEKELMLVYEDADDPGDARALDLIGRDAK